MDAFRPAVETLRGWLVDFVHTLPHIIAASIALLLFLATIIRRRLKIPLERIFRKSHSADTLVQISGYLIYCSCVASGLLHNVTRKVLTNFGIEQMLDMNA